MEWRQIEGNWNQFKGKIRQQWADLTDDDLEKIKGSREQLEGKLQERYGMAKEAISETVDKWLKTIH